MPKDTFPLHLIPRKHLEAIGCVATQWSLLELVIEECILGAAGFKETPFLGRTITTHMGITQRLDALLSLVHEIMPDSDVEQELKKINRLIRYERGGHPSLQSERNAIIHSHWEKGIQANEAFISSIRSRGKLSISGGRVKPDQILGVADRIRQTTLLLFNWQDRFYQQIENLPPS